MAGTDTSDVHATRRAGTGRRRHRRGSGRVLPRRGGAGPAALGRRRRRRHRHLRVGTRNPHRSSWRTAGSTSPGRSISSPLAWPPPAGASSPGTSAAMATATTPRSTPGTRTCWPRSPSWRAPAAPCPSSATPGRWAHDAAGRLPSASATSNLDGLPSRRPVPDVANHDRTRMLATELAGWLDHRRRAGRRAQARHHRRAGPPAGP